MADATEAEVIIETARASAEPKVIDPDYPSVVIVPEGAEARILDPEPYGDSPRRKHGTVTLREAASFCTYVGEQALEHRTRLYADLDSATIIAVINDHASTAVEGEDAGWGDHRAILRLKHTPEWQHWASKDRVALGQTAFAEHIEDGLTQIIHPEAALMLEMAQTFQATNRVAFKSESRLANGQRQLSYEEQIEAKAGQKGNLTVPERLELALVPFDGMDPYRVEARLRFRITDGQLKITYLLDRPHEVVRSAFGDVCALVANQTRLVPLLGTPRA